MNKIFVSIASYRDDECNPTINSLFENAKDWTRCNVGICQQNNKSDTDCLASINEIWKCNIRILRIPYIHAKGPTYARYLCSGLWNGEEYYFQIDSHTTFTKDWDEKLINMIKEIKNQNLSDKPVISHYPEDRIVINDKNNDVPHIYTAQYDDNDILVFSSAIYTNMKDGYKRGYFIAGGMFFCEAKFLEEIPFDPSLDNLFMGEEILTSVRFFTYGWDVFSPKENIIFHEYTRADKPKYTTDSKERLDSSKAQQRVKNILDINYKEDDKYNEYGLGKIRTLEDYYSKITILPRKTEKPEEKTTDKTIEGFNGGRYRIHNNQYIMSLIIILFIILLICFILLANN